MAIELISISKQADDRYGITVKDTISEQTYSVTYNPATGKDALKKNLEAIIAKKATLSSDEDTIEQDIKLTVESIK